MRSTQRVSRLPPRYVVVEGRRTTVRLEASMWDALRDIARRQNCSIHDVVTEVERNRTLYSLTASIRAHIIKFYHDAAVQATAAAAERESHAAHP